MSESYVAWNGRSYPWPPPDGWYEASDGLWWAPGTGPDPSSPPTPPTAEAARKPYPTAAGAEGDGATEQLTLGAALGSPTEQETVTRELATRASDEPARPEQQETGPSDDDIGVWTSGDEPARARRPWVPIVAGGVLLAVIVAGVVAVAIAGGEDDGAGAEPPSTTTIPTTAETAPPPTSTTAPATTTSTISDAEKVAGFRAALVANDLSGEQLSDDDIIEFGTAFCVFAAIAQDDAEFDEFRQQAIADSDGELTDAEMVVAIDTSVGLFCPADAGRLGITSAAG